MAEQKLNLLERTARTMAQTRTRAPEIVRCERGNARADRIVHTLGYSSFQRN